jgi:hypothetical protein
MIGLRRKALKFSFHIPSQGTRFFVPHHITTLFAITEEDDFDREIVPISYKFQSAKIEEGQHTYTASNMAQAM